VIHRIYYWQQKNLLSPVVFFRTTLYRKLKKIISELLCSCQEAKLFCRTDKILPESLIKRKEGKSLSNFLAEHILILPGSLKIRERVKTYKYFLAEHIKYCQEAWKEEEKVKYFRNFLAVHISNLPGRIMWNFFVQNTSGFIPWEHMFSKYCSLAAFDNGILDF